MMTRKFSRRRFICSSAALFGGALIPSVTPALNMNYLQIQRLHPVRFIAGLVFNLAQAVVIKVVADEIVQALKQHDMQLLAKQARLETCDHGICIEGSNFQHPNYKASMVVLGVANYEAHKERQLRLLMEDQAQQERIRDTLQYLRDERIDVRLHGDLYSRRVSLDTEPDDLFTLDYLLMASHQEQHYMNLIDITGTQAFKGWNA